LELGLVEVALDGFGECRVRHVGVDVTERLI
jgi:hypothetical protein